MLAGESALAQTATLVAHMNRAASDVTASRLQVQAKLNQARRELAMLRELVARTKNAPDDPGPTDVDDAEPQVRHPRPGETSPEDDVVVKHIGLAHSIAARYAARGEELDDLRQVALLGLVKAAHRFDPARNVQFSTYATASIVGEIKRHFRDKRWALHVPRADQELYLRVRDAAEGLSTALGHSPTIEEIARRAGVSTEDVVSAQELSTLFELRSLDALRAVDGGRKADIGARDDSYELIESRIGLLPALKALSENERQLIMLRFRDGLSQSDIGQRLGMSQMQVSRMLSSTLAKLRARISGNNLSTG